jgi:hypothetical protein
MRGSVGFGVRSREMGRGEGAGVVRRLPVAALAGLMVLVSVTLLTPSVAAGSVGATPKIESAPFSGTPLALRELFSEGCGTATLPHGPTFDFGSGVGRGEANATANSSSACSTPVISNIGEAVSWFGLSTLNFTKSTGLHTIKATWDLQWTVSLHASQAGSSTGGFQTACVLGVLVEIFDVTTDNGVGSNEWSKVVNRTGDTSLNVVSTKSLTLGLNYTFNGSDVYTFQTVVEYEAAVETAQGATTGQGSASINLATGGDKATLVSITGV